MKFSAPVPAASEPSSPTPSFEPLSQPAMRGQVFDAVVDGVEQEPLDNGPGCGQAEDQR